MLISALAKDHKPLYTHRHVGDCSLRLRNGWTATKLANATVFSDWSTATVVASGGHPMASILIVPSIDLASLLCVVLRVVCDVDYGLEIFNKYVAPQPFLCNAKLDGDLGFSNSKAVHQFRHSVLRLFGHHFGHNNTINFFSLILPCFLSAPSNPCNQIAWRRPPRPWVKRLYKKLTRAKQAKLREKQQKQKIKVVKKYIDKNGRERVILNWI